MQHYTALQIEAKDSSKDKHALNKPIQVSFVTPRLAYSAQMSFQMLLLVPSSLHGPP